MEFRTDLVESLRFAEVHWLRDGEHYEDGRTRVAAGIATHLTDDHIRIVQEVLPNGDVDCPREIMRDRIVAAYWIADGTPIMWPDGKLASEPREEVQG